MLPSGDTSRGLWCGKWETRSEIYRSSLPVELATVKPYKDLFSVVINCSQLIDFHVVFARLSTELCRFVGKESRLWPGPAAGARCIQFLTHESTPLSIDPYSMVPDSRVCPNRKAAVANSLLVEGSRLCKIPLLY